MRRTASGLALQARRARPAARALAAACLTAASLFFFARPARAHEFRPAILEVTSAGAGRFDVTWTPAPDMDRVQIVFPPSCARDPDEGRRFLLDCGPPGLAGQTLSATGLAPLRDEVLVRLRLEGTETTALLTAARPSLALPAADPASPPLPASSPFPTFVVTGAAHLLTGPDHILFVLGLLLLVLRRADPIGASPSRTHAAALLRAITAFTVAHSLTLALQVLGAVRLPPAPVEAAIALSVLLLARELTRAPGHAPTPAPSPTPALADSPAPGASPDPASLTARRPWAAAFVFGLLHGLGFAGGLSVLRVPDSQIPAALLGFNVGLELAQLALVAAVLLAARALRTGLLAPRIARLPRWTLRAPAYGIGVAAAFWTLQRIAAFWA